MYLMNLFIVALVLLVIIGAVYYTLSYFENKKENVVDKNNVNQELEEILAQTPIEEVESETIDVEISEDPKEEFDSQKKRSIASRLKFQSRSR